MQNFSQIQPFLRSPGCPKVFLADTHTHTHTQIHIQTFSDSSSTEVENDDEKKRTKFHVKKEGNMIKLYKG